jgi:hypothetical protein
LQAGAGRGSILRFNGIMQNRCCQPAAAAAPQPCGGGGGGGLLSRTLLKNANQYNHY